MRISNECFTIGGRPENRRRSREWMWACERKGTTFRGVSLSSNAPKGDVPEIEKLTGGYK